MPLWHGTCLTESPSAFGFQTPPTHAMQLREAMSLEMIQDVEHQQDNDNVVAELDTVESAYHTFLRYLDRIRGRLTKPRLSVARWVMQQSECFTDTDIANEVKRRGLPIGPRSISKTLTLLTKCGLIIKLDNDLNPNPRYVSLACRNPGTLCMVCIDCGTIHTCLLPNASLQTRKIVSDHDHTPLFEARAAKGYCQECKAQQLQKQKSA